MPHVAFICPDERMSDQVEIPDCLTCSQTRLDRGCPWNHTLLSIMVEEQDDRISPTRLASCARKAALKRRYPYALDPSDQFRAVRGTVFHAGLDTLTADGGLREVDLVREFEGHTIQGRADLVYPERGLIVDWKSKVYVPKRNDPKKPKTHLPHWRHVLQLSIYAWLCETEGWEITKGELIYFDMSKVRRECVDLLSRGEVEAYLRTRLPGLTAAYGSGPLPPPVWGTEDADLCEYCHLRELCEELAIEEYHDREANALP